MGAFCGHSDGRSREYYRTALLASIERGSVRQIQRISHRLSRNAVLPFSLEDPILTVQGVELNSLCYAFRLGRTEIVQFLLEDQQKRVEQLYTTFGKIGKTPMDFICEYGFVDLLRFFLPIHLARGRLCTKPEQSRDYSLFDSVDVKAVYSYSTQKAVHRACEKGRIEVIRYLHGHFAGRRPPADLDIHMVDESSGENCALIASRIAHFPLVKFLYEVCDADFHRRNARGESALQLAVSASKRTAEVGLLDCVIYLVETVKVSVEYEFEETLLLCDRADILQYIEARLLRVGIARSKQQVETKFRLARSRPDVDTVSQGELLLGHMSPDSQVSSIQPRSTSPNDSSLGCSFSKH